VASARAGVGTHMITRLGKDDFANLAFGIWQKAGVTPHVVQDAESYTGSAFIFIQEGTGQNAVLVAPGAASLISAQDVDAQSALIAKAKVFITNFEVPMVACERGLHLARSAGVTTVLNPAPAGSFPKGLLAFCNYVTPNESEAEALTGFPVASVKDAIPAARKLVEMGAGCAIITMGAQGVVYYKDGVAVLVPAKASGKVIDTTGAGDAFNGGFSAALARGMSDQEALVFGSATAGIAVTRMGTAASMPALNEIEAHMQSIRIEVLD
jgi:ribokinase